MTTLSEKNSPCLHWVGVHISYLALEPRNDKWSINARSYLGLSQHRAKPYLTGGSSVPEAEVNDIVRLPTPNNNGSNHERLCFNHARSDTLY